MIATLKRLEMWKLRLPLRVSFKHASAVRTVTESVWVEVADSDGKVGYGEGCPRRYVTGETLESCREFFEGCRGEVLARVGSVEELRVWVGENRGVIDRAPAAWCAIEMALLDLFARQEGRSVEALLGVPEIDGVFRYTAVLGDQGDGAFGGQLAKYRGWGFEDFKIKLSGDPGADRKKFERLAAAGVDPERVRVDANNLWATEAEALGHLGALKAGFSAVEEPVRADQIGELRGLGKALGMPMILDESFLRVGQFGLIEEDSWRWWINLRVSKMGGVMRSLEVARGAVERGIGVVVGAQVGETSLLTRAALTVAQFVGGRLRGQEGAFGTHLLEVDVVDEPLMFAAGGELDTSGYSGIREGFRVVRPEGGLGED